MELKVENLSCGYGKEPVLKQMNFTIKQGELWCILGPNGIGKTTLFKTILGLIKEKSGSVLIDGKHLNQWSRKELAKMIAYVPQVHIPPFPFRVIDVVLMGRNPYLKGNGKVRSKDIDQAFDALHLFQIDHLSNKSYTEISGGERQLVLFARAVAQDTPFLVLDEPVSNLDFGNQWNVIEYIRQIVEMGKTVIMTTHNPDYAFLPDCRVVLITKDKTVKTGEGNQLLTEGEMQNIYGISSRIIDLNQEGINRKICVPLYQYSHGIQE